jgi:cellulose synthase/poly-beta-1,6-N-acetylglucosamine synthase-like glycosyltransferase
LRRAVAEEQTALPIDPVLRANSPRYTPVPTPLASTLIHGGVALLWLLLFAGAFAFTGIFAWSVGLVYIAYDTVLLGLTLVATWPLRHARPAPVAAGPTSLAVIVAAHNEAKVLPVTIAALFAQGQRPDRIIVADDGSTDGTAALLMGDFGIAAPDPGGLSADSPSHPGLAWLRLPHGGKAAALNVALAAIDSEIVLTVDADTLLEPGAIAAIRAAFAADPNLVAATGVLTPVCDASVGGRLFEWFQSYEYIRNFLSRYAWERANGLLLISGAFAGFRRAAVIAVGGFDRDCLVEDYELIHRLRRHGVRAGHAWTTAVVGGARARTAAPADLPAFLAQRRRWFGGFLQTQYWYRDMVGDRRYGHLGTWMLPVKAFDTLQPVFGLTAFFLLVWYLALGRVHVLLPVAIVIGSKIVIDLAFHLWSLRLYRTWAGGPPMGHAAAVLASLVEPFSFQLLRHTGAALGWVTFLSGRQTWGAQSRGGLVRAA